MSESKEVYDLNDLRSWSDGSASLDPPARLAVIGDPVKHSRSPQMHNPALKETGKEGQYVRIHVSPEEVEEALDLMAKAEFFGTNVTIPHKGAVHAAMDDVTEVARRIGAVNTVVFEGGEKIGHNTDAPGLKKAIREEFSMDLTDLRIMVIGAGGGAGKAASVQCAMDHCDRLVLVNRTVEKAEALAAELEELLTDPDRLEGPADRLKAIAWEAKEMERELDQIDLIINATSIGMKRTDPMVVPEALLAPHHLVYDMVYAPARTRLMADAEAAGARAANGLGMLLWQGILAYEFWFPQKAPIEAMRRGLHESL